MLSDRMAKALNEQVNAELYSGYIYLAMAAYLESADLPGAAHWMRMQQKEEDIHAMKIFDYIVAKGNRAEMKAIEAPPFEWESPLAAFEAAYAHEVKVTGLINGLVNLAIEEKDHATNAFLQWFVTEQVEEEESTQNVARQFRLLGNAGGGGLFMLDKELGMRPAPAPPVAE